MRARIVNRIFNSRTIPGRVLNPCGPIRPMRPIMNFRPRVLINGGLTMSSIFLATNTTTNTKLDQEAKTLSTATVAETLKEKSENPLYLNAFVRCDKEVNRELCQETVNYAFDVKKQIEREQSDDPVANTKMHENLERNVLLFSSYLMKRCAAFHASNGSKKYNCDEEVHRIFALAAYSFGRGTIPNFGGITISAEVTDIDSLLALISKDQMPPPPKIQFTK